MLVIQSCCIVLQRLRPFPRCRCLTKPWWWSRCTFSSLRTCSLPGLIKVRLRPGRWGLVGGSGAEVGDARLHPSALHMRDSQNPCSRPHSSNQSCLSFFFLFYLCTCCSSDLRSHYFHSSLLFDPRRVSLCRPSTYLPFPPPPAWWNALISGFHLKQLTYRRPISFLSLHVLESEPWECVCVCCAQDWLIVGWKT